jgi:signal transduction histidine kinase
MRRVPGTCDHHHVPETPDAERTAPAGPPTGGESAAPPRLDRRADGRLVGGVCAGLAEHLGLEPIVVRLGFAVLISAGVGIIAYVALWLLVPQRVEPAKRREPGQFFAYGALVCALCLFTWGSGALNWAVWPIVAGGIGVGIIWQQADPERRQRWVRNSEAMWLRSIVGALLVVGGLIAFLAQRIKPGQAGQVLFGSTVVLAGVGVVVAPWLLRMWRDLDTERHERIRSQERAEVAAHVHDSVLHTLTLIQRSAHDPREVQRLARSQERDLRAWLYEPKADAEVDLAAAVRKAAAEVEDHHGVPIEVVCVGDCPLDERLGAMLQAAREAMVNAAKYAGDEPSDDGTVASSLSVYAEVAGDDVAIFVRDRGKGFDLDAIPEDRMGLRESIIGRMERNGGKATIRTAPGEGTEVRLEMKRS